MRFEITAEPENGIRVIPDIPNYRLCRLEGRNGVGKTLAVRLLQLCVGDQPYQGVERAWTSLREHLGPVLVKATHLKDGHTVEWDLEPSEWPVKPGPLAAGISVRIDGKSSSLDAARALLDVQRIVGEETLIGTIARRIVEDGRTVQRVRDRLLERRVQVAASLTEVQGDLARVNVERFRDARRALEDGRASLRALIKDSEQHAERARVLAEAQRYSTIESVLRVRGPTVEKEIAEIDKLLIKARKDREGIQHHVDQLRPQRARRSRLLSTYEELQLAVKRRRVLLRNTRERLDVAAKQADVSPTESAAEAALQAGAAELEKLAIERRELDVTPLVVTVVREVGNRLRRASDDGLEDQVIAELETREDVTVSELRGAFERRRRALLARPKPEEVEVLDAQISSLLRRHQLLEEVTRLARRADANLRSLGDAEHDLEAIVVQLRQTENKAYTEALQSLNRARDRELELEARRGEAVRELQRLTEGLTVQEVGARLTRVLRSLEITRAQLEHEGVASEEARRQLADRRASDEQRIADAEATIEDSRVGLHSVISILARNPAYLALRKAIASLQPSEDLNEDANLDRIQALQKHCVAIAELLDSTYRAVDSLVGPLDALASLIEQGTEPPAGMLYIAGLRENYYEPVLTDELSRSEIEEALFDGGKLRRLDLKDMRAIYIDKVGQERARPLEALSSGERVFMYTMARLSSRPSRTTDNRVFFLDEFGAFVAHDRLRRLVEILKADVLNRLADQVVVILPLTAEHDQPADAPSAGIPEQELAERNYFAVPFAGFE